MDFADAANWLDSTSNLDPASAPPAPGDTMMFGAGSDTISGVGIACAMQSDDGRCGRSMTFQMPEVMVPRPSR
jgi:hypothetical protein